MTVGTSVEMPAKSEYDDGTMLYRRRPLGTSLSFVTESRSFCATSFPAGQCNALQM